MPGSEMLKICASVHKKEEVTAADPEEKALAGTELTLKNIYRVLTWRDYPVYSMGILSERNRRGLTILKFYRENLLDDWSGGRV